MRAVVHDRYGPPEVLRLEDVDRPVPGPGDVLVRVRATTVNQTDCHMFTHQDALTPKDLVSYAAELGLDVEQFASDLASHAGAARVAEDVDSADLSGVSGTPTFFVNGKRHQGAYDIQTLSNAVRVAGAQALVATPE